jgi:hypothetical protein
MTHRAQLHEQRRAPFQPHARALICPLVLALTVGMYAGTAGALEPAASAPSAPAAPAAPAAQQSQASQPVQLLQPAQPSRPSSYSASALYNVGNAYARAGKPGPAVLNYERAWLLDPGDPDIKANLHFVQVAAGFAPESPSRFSHVATRAGPRILAWLGFLGLLIAGASLVARQLYPGYRRRLGGAALAGIVLMGSTVCNAIALWPTLHAAVVIAPSAPVRVAPVANEEPSFVLPEAQIVTVNAEHDGFVLIRTKAGRIGWVPQANLALVVQKQ